MLVGNKSDLDNLRKVSKQDGLSFAEKNRVAFYEVSAKTGSNIDLIFSKIAEELEKIMVENEKAK
jgi:Ras-related protein Rab-6A